MVADENRTKGSAVIKPEKINSIWVEENPLEDTRKNSLLDKRTKSTANGAMIKVSKATEVIASNLTFPFIKP